jgi:hypothetical protein
MADKRKKTRESAAMIVPPLAEVSNFELWPHPLPPDPLDERTMRRGLMAPLARKSDFWCILYARFGQSYDVIRRVTGLSHSQIGARLRKYHVSPKDYRNGSKFAFKVIKATTDTLLRDVIQEQRWVQAADVHVGQLPQGQQRQLTAATSA